MKIELTQGFFAIIDDEDYDLVKDYKWHPRKGYSTIYVQAHFGSGKTRKTVTMHRFLLNPEKGIEVDHINHNGLDNRRCNLRLVTKSQNMMNRITNIGVSSYKGVSFSKEKKKWSSQIKGNTNLLHLGFFYNEIEAAAAYNLIAKLIFKEYALLNNIDFDYTDEFVSKVTTTYNKALNRTFASYFIGVTFDKRSSKWQARLCYDYKQFYIGYYKTEKEAALAYNEFALQRLGDKAVLNVIE